MSCLQVWDVSGCGRQSRLGLLGSCRMKITWSNWMLWEWEKSPEGTGCSICLASGELVGGDRKC